jgi:hypothetical protein
MIRILNFFKRLFFGSVVVPPTQAVITVPVAVPPSTSTVKPERNITIVGNNSCNPNELKRIPLIVDKMYSVIFSDDFMAWMCNPSNRLDLEQTNGLTARQCVELLRTKQADAILAFYFSRLTSTVGYRNDGSNIIYCNRKFHNNFSILDEASNVTHEISHLMGFDHDFQNTSRRPYSFPYRINAAFDGINQ